MPGLKRHLVKKVMKAKRANVPGVFRDLERMDNKTGAFGNAAKIEFQTLHLRQVMNVISPSQVPFDENIVSCAALLTIKRCGRIKAPCVFNGRQQGVKLLQFIRSPMLSENT